MTILDGSFRLLSILLVSFRFFSFHKVLIR